VAFVVSPADLEELIDARRGRVAAVAAYDEYLRRVSGRLSAEAAMLDDTAVAALVEEAHLEQPPAGLPA
jgi:hypothetical protein